jgi:PhoD related phosphatase
MSGHAATAPGHSTATGATAAAIGSAWTKNPSTERTVPPEATQQPTPTTVQNGEKGHGNAPQVAEGAQTGDVLCGPLLNYRHMSNAQSPQPTWHGSVLVVTKPGTPQPELTLRCVGRVDVGSGSETQAAANNNVESHLPAGHSLPGAQTFRGEKLYEDPNGCFWRFTIDLPIQDFEARWGYTIPRLQFRFENSATKVFVVPSRSQSMRIMFCSCNGFSVGTDLPAWSGPGGVLWKDVLRMHASQPFHVMLGGGDQIYNDGVRVDGPLRPWTDIGNPKKRREFPFNEKMRKDCDLYYFNNYVKWYSSDAYRDANSTIPQVNIWDDHDIIDGFGSYTDHFMRCSVFRGIGGVAHKYYLLFQHHLAPPKSTFSTDAPQTDNHGQKTTPADSVQLQDSWVLEEPSQPPSYIIGAKSGPYVEEHSRSMYCQLGARIAFVGIDARTERTRHQINYPETYDLIFQRVERELGANTNIKHLILLLGVPIAYPRLQWLENIFQSPIIGPIRFLNKRFGVAGSFFNHFDGQVDLLDDLDDHYTAHHHKKERKDLMLRLQALSKKFSVRISILGGDVHLCAIGRFYSNHEQGIPAERDWRYMPNIVSSAITNKPPPAAVANLLARRNKIHHLDHQTDETLLEIFDRDPGVTSEADKSKNGNGPGRKTADGNHATMPSRNYAIIAESRDHSVPQSGSYLQPPTTGAQQASSIASASSSKKPNPRKPIHDAEKDAGTKHPAASGLTKTGLGGEFGLDVTLRVEINSKDAEGRTDGYGFSVPGLDCRAYAGEGEMW